MATDIGAKLSRQGIDVNTAADSDLIWSTSFSSLKYALEKKMSGVTYAAGFTIPHNLGYPPAFQCYWIRNGFLQPFDYDRFRVDKDNFYMDAEAITASPFDVLVTIFPIDLSKEYVSPQVNSGTGRQQQFGDNDIGIKLSKPGKDASSEDMRDFIFHSACRSPLVHMVKPGTTTNYTNTGGFPRTRFVFNHSLGYLPMIMGYVQLSLGVYGQLPGGFDTVRITGATTSEAYYDAFGSTQHTVTIVVLKDPFLTENVSTVVA